MASITYAIVEHDGGWAYKLDDVFSETFVTREEAVQAAQRAGQEQQVSGEAEAISYQDSDGVWHEEQASGTDRPSVEIV